MSAVTRPLTGVLDALFLRHPKQVGESYLRHLWFATKVGARLIAAGTACLIHALVPALCEARASREIEDLHRLLSHRH